MTDSQQEHVITLDGMPIARIIPLGRQTRARARRFLVDTSALPPVPDDTLNYLLDRAPRPAQSSFTDEEIREAVDLDRAEAWRAKHA